MNASVDGLLPVLVSLLIDIPAIAPLAGCCAWAAREPREPMEIAMLNVKVLRERRHVIETSFFRDELAGATVTM
jgi:hypothetical protein